MAKRFTPKRDGDGGDGDFAPDASLGKEDDSSPDVAVLEAPATTVAKPSATNFRRGEESDDNYLNRISRVNREKMAKVYARRTAGEHRWRIQCANFAYFIYFDCETDKESHAKGLWFDYARTNIPAKHSDRFAFVYMGKTKDLGPAPVNEMIPLGERSTTYGPPPKSLVDQLKED